MPTSAAQRLRAEFEKLAGLGDAAAHQAALPGDHGHLAGELAGAVRRHGALAVDAGLHDFHASREQHEERNGGIAGFKKDVAALDVSHVATGTDAFDLLRRKDAGTPECGRPERWEEKKP